MSKDEVRIIKKHVSSSVIILIVFIGTIIVINIISNIMHFKDIKKSLDEITDRLKVIEKVVR